MEHAYDKVYLERAQQALAGMLDFATYGLGYEVKNFFDMFISSGVADKFGSGDFTLIAGKSGVELAYEVMDKSHLEYERVKPEYTVNRSKEFWLGWALAYHQWYTGMSFREIIQYVPVEQLLALYVPYHEMDIRQFVDKVNELYLKGKRRCSWCNINNPVYVDYHDNEWGVPCHDDHALFELLVLEGFQAGLSWETILNKRENFREAFDGFDLEAVASYDQDKIDELLQNKGIVRNKRKVNAAVKNTNVFKEIQQEFGSFSDYIWGWTDGEVIYENDKTTSDLSDKISKDLKKRGMTFVGSTIIYSYLQAIGVINSHEDGCWKMMVSLFPEFMA